MTKSLSKSILSYYSKNPKC